MKAGARQALLGSCASIALCTGLLAVSGAPDTAFAYIPAFQVPNAGQTDNAVAHRDRGLHMTFAYRGKVLGSMPLIVLSDGTLQIPLDALLPLLSRAVDAGTLDALRARAAKADRAYVTQDDLNAVKLDVGVDLSTPKIPSAPMRGDGTTVIDAASLPSSRPSVTTAQAESPAALPQTPTDSTLTESLGSSLAANNQKPVQLASTSVIVPLPSSSPRVDVAPPVVPPTPVVPHPPSKTINLIVPLKERNFYVGDITIGILPDGTVDMPLDRILELLKAIASPDLIDALKKQAGGRQRISFADLDALKLSAHYDPSTLEVGIVLPMEDRKRRDIELFDLDRLQPGQFSQPASPSAWLTWRTSFDYVNAGSSTGFVSPAIDLNGAMRIFGVSLSAGGNVDTGDTSGHPFTRDYTRLTYDVPENAQRWQLGDLDPAVEGFQSSPDMAGISLLKSYSVLQPGRNVRPRGLTSFSLRDPSQVDVLINGQFVSRLNLDVGTYDLHDFPFTAGQNNVQLVVQDPTGQRELYSYQQFFDLDLLEAGLSEYQLAVGVAAPFANGQPRYETNEPVATGFYRQGISDDLTLGVNAQADKSGALLGAESVWASPLGMLSANQGVSRVDGRKGWAAMLNFQHQNNPVPGGHRWSLGFDVTATSKWFSAIGNKPSANDTAIDAEAYYTRDLSTETTLNINAGYLWKRDGQENVGTARVALYQRIGEATSIGVEGRWDQSLTGHRDLSVFLTINTRFGSDQYASASYDGATDQARVSWQKTPTDIYNDWSLTADAERVPGSTAVNASAYREWNRLETSITHSATFDENGQKISDERTSLRVAGSIAYADGTVAIGRPIQDSFAIVDTHPSLDGSTVRIDPHGDGEAASTDALGPALVPDLAAYSRRTLTVGVDKLPTGYNLGSGSFDLMPPYQGGYKLTVGSDFSISVIGVLDDRDGKPVPLVAGKAYQVSDPKDHPIELFTDRKGRFAAVGLKPGLWRIELGPYKYDLDIKKDGKTLRRLAEPLMPVEEKP